KNKYVITRDYAKRLMQKMDVFELHSKTNKRITLALITTMGIKHNVYSEDLVTNEISLVDLFK
ncbi:MAG TPA: ATPase, partial [Gammaproteobacteria bacterium]|nr:ATPase [Gammaproteobacteria bacterium]